MRCSRLPAKIEPFAELLPQGLYKSYTKRTTTRSGQCLLINYLAMLLACVMFSNSLDSLTERMADKKTEGEGGKETALKTWSGDLHEVVT